MPQNHVIHSLQIEMEVSAEGTAFQLRDALNHYWQQWVAVHLEKALDAISPSDATIRIDRLEIDLETLDAGSFDADFPDRVEKLFSNRLQEIIHSKSIPHLISSNSITERDLLVSFLKTGTVPWWSQSNNNIDFDLIINHLWRERPEDLKSVLLNAFMQKDSLVRLLYQINNQLVSEILFDLFSMQLQREKIEQQIVLFRKSNDQLVEKEIEKCMIFMLLAHLEKLQTLNAPLDLQSLVTRFLPFLKLSEWEQLSGAISKNPDVAVSKETETALHFEDIAPDEQTKYVLKKAGIVLIAPFLPQLFKELKLLAEKGGALKDEPAAFKAVALLAYIGSGKTLIPEFELTLEKLLCGIPIHEPVPLDCDLTEAEIHEADELLNAVITHWNVIKSVDGLREAFFDREGMLQDMGSSWLIRVEKKSFDVLLDHKPPPWGFRLLKFAWNPKMIETEW